EATNAAGCTSFPIDPVTVTQSGPASPIGVGFTVTNAFSDNQVITIQVQGYGNYEYQLEDGPWQDSNIFTNVVPRRTPYTVHVRDKDACSDFITDIPEVNVIDYPRYFTPNGDGYNDYWNIFGLSSQGGAEIYIFDRYGKLIKQISSQSEGWDGTYNGSPLPADDYWFTVTFNEETISIQPLRDASGAIVNDPVTNEPIMVEVPLELTREFKAHFSLKR
ncbi:T9SS type B sorting domain-containing protein, partial [Flavobacterium salilacus subsp. salilacus]|uniref:T9SS type B sorting domain-containing protein n=2 Tax=Flavobacterium TaxID=237 RepID=UPI001074E1DA